MTLVLRYIARSDRGLVRSNNEDSVYAGARLLALADGMGGHAAGEVASQLVIQSMRSLDDDDPGGDLLSKLDRAVHNGNSAIHAQVEASPDLDGMGTTLTAILFAGSRIGLCHIGDSRGYLFRDGQLSQITRDDTFVQTLVDEGRITAEQAHTHPQRSLIMRALTGQEIEPTLTMREARAGDRYLLCSDGLSDVVSEETLSDTLGSIADYKACADRLIELALRGGGPDNVTVIVADVVDNEIGESRPIVGGAAGGDDEGYTPNPSTAAGRAAALRPPPSEPQRPTIFADEEPARTHSPLRRWLTVGAVLAVIAVLAIGFFLTRAMVQKNYFVGEQDGNVVVFQGSPDKVLFLDLSSAAQDVCVTGLDQTAPQVDFVDYGNADDACAPLEVSELAELDRNAVVGNSIKNLSLADAQNRVMHLNFLPLCPAPAPATPAPAPVPDVSQTISPAPSAPPSSSPSDIAGGPASTPPNAGPTTTTTAIPAQYDSDGTKICRGH
ncbi:PP2C family serine/threonine-protein phosphatase [Gordonia sp. CPCC 205515]|uniref:PP2C family protein-serine/threonine phosphatase n=1 Tax=Gordonia sp. CPCC 205515 TaxID=3140791 RepID=UPI003AF3B42C